MLFEMTNIVYTELKNPNIIMKIIFYKYLYVEICKVFKLCSNCLKSFCVVLIRMKFVVTTVSLICDALYLCTTKQKLLICCRSGFHMPANKSKMCIRDSCYKVCGFCCALSYFVHEYFIVYFL